MLDEDRFAQVADIQPAIILARAGLGATVRALGDHSVLPVLARENREDLRRLAVIQLAETNGTVTNGRHASEGLYADSEPAPTSGTMDRIAVSRRTGVSDVFGEKNVEIKTRDMGVE